MFINFVIFSKGKKKEKKKDSFRRASHQDTRNALFRQSA